MYTEEARAKINLNLHVGRLVDEPGHKYDGYHPLSSLVVFADYGDLLSCEPADKTALEISGPFSQGLATDGTNLVLKAYNEVARHTKLPALKFKLRKDLPVASGIGGGSADAAAVLRLLKNFVDLSNELWLDIALAIGADVPVCFYSKTCIMTGIGETLHPQDMLGNVDAVLLNPLSPVSTGAVFRAFDETKPSHKIKPQPDGNIIERLAASDNDLQSVAIKINPDIEIALDALGAETARMSGSGASCFQVVPSRDAAIALCSAIKSAHPDWWVQPVKLGDP